MSEEPRQEDLLREAAAGDPEALSRLYHRYAEDLYRLAFGLTESSADAHDVVQDVFVGLPEALRAFEGHGSFERWLKRIAVRAAHMKLRSRRMWKEVPLATIRNLFLGGEPGAAVERLELERAIASLPDELRVVVVLKEIEGLSHREIGELLGITRELSAVRHHRAMRALRITLSEEP